MGHGKAKKKGGHKSHSNKKKKGSKGSKGSKGRGGSKHKFVLKGKLPPKAKDGIVGPSRLLPDQMTTIYSIPNEHFKTEKDVVEFNGYEVLNQIGKGGFAVVFKAKNKKGDMCACKTVQIKDQDAILEMKNELFIMEMVDNPFAVRLHLHFLVNQTLYIFMQLADAGCFGNLLEKDGALNETDSKFYFAQMVCGVEFMHAKNIAHRDIKPANFLMANHPSGKVIVLISDYGLSRMVHKDDNGGPMMYTTQCGTPAYMAPEIITGKEYNCYLVDVWSLGVTLYAMLNLRTPFNANQKDYGAAQMKAGQWEWSKGMKAPPSDGLKDITKGMLCPDTGKRLTIQKMASHPWLSSDYEGAKKLVKK